MLPSRSAKTMYGFIFVSCDKLIYFFNRENLVYCLEHQFGGDPYRWCGQHETVEC